MRHERAMTPTSALKLGLSDEPTPGSHQEPGPGQMEHRSSVRKSPSTRSATSGGGSRAPLGMPAPIWVRSRDGLRRTGAGGRRPRLHQHEFSGRDGSELYGARSRIA